jgi:hypothetical protein
MAVPLTLFFMLSKTGKNVQKKTGKQKKPPVDSTAAAPRFASTSDAVRQGSRGRAMAEPSCRILQKYSRVSPKLQRYGENQ